MPINLFIAIRYIFTKRNFQFITIISFISIIGITIGVAALIVVMSIFNGFQELTEKQLVGYDPHVRISTKKGTWLKSNDSLIKYIDQNNEIKSLSSIISGKVVGINKNIIQVFSLQGIDDENNKYYNDLKKSIVFGKFKFEKSGLPNIVIGAGLSEKLKVLPGDTLLIVSPKMLESSISSFKPFQSTSSIVSGIYQTNIQDYDYRDGFVLSITAKKIFYTPNNSISNIDLRLSEPKKSFKIANDLKNIVDNQYQISTWQDLNSELYKIMKFEKVAAFLILSLIIVLAVFNVLVSLTMTVVEKKPDISTLKAMGANTTLIRNIFLTEGSFIGILSTISGIIIGLAFCYGQIYFKFFRIDTNKYIIDAIPVSINYLDVLIIGIVSLFLSSIATIYPSFRASKQEIIKGIKAE